MGALVNGDNFDKVIILDLILKNLIFRVVVGDTNYVYVKKRVNTRVEWLLHEVQEPRVGRVWDDMRRECLRNLSEKLYGEWSPRKLSLGTYGRGL